MTAIYWKLFTDSPLIYLVIGSFSANHGRYQHICHTTTSMRILQTKKPLFPFDTNDVTQNLDCWWSKLWVNNSMWHIAHKDDHPMRGSTDVGTQNSPSSSLWICMDQPPKLHETERTVTKTNAIVKSAENTSFLQLFYFFSLVYLFH